ncbi:MAG TPA: hypothetical protein VFD69_01020 [Vicinamibacterales bacterium]|jgi:hypothetical protein|nr:hypothetical protein [Vicinamibacterales bacterium]
MLTLLAALIVLHGLIHLLGVAKAFGWADLPQLMRPITPLYGALWLAAAMLFGVTATALFAWPRWSWELGLCAVMVSTIVIVPSWSDAKAGAIANAVVLLGLFLMSRGR